MGSSVVGSGTKVAIIPGQNTYFRVKATTTGFASLVQTLVIIMQPTGPSAMVVNDVTNTLTWTNSPDFANIADYEYTTNNGTSWTTCTAKPIVIGNIAVAIGEAQVRIKAIAATRFSSTVLKSASAFTISTGIADIATLGVKVYPNPVNNFLKLENVPANTEASIWSADGKLVKTIHLENKNNEIDVTSLPNGLYFLKLQSSKGKGVMRFVKQ